MKLTIEEIARKTGTSRSTVSRVLSGHPNVKEETRIHIKKIMEELDYRPNRLAQGLATGSINIVGLIVGDIRNPYYSEITRAVETVLNEEGYMVVLCDSDYNPLKEEHFLRVAIEMGFASVIMTSAMETDELKKILDNLHCPLILLNRQLETIQTDVVSFDNFRGGYLVAEHLIKYGHKDIQVLAGPARSSSSNARFAGYKKALEDYGLNFSDANIAHGDLRLETGYEFGLKLLREKSRSTAVIAGNDMMAIGLIQAFRDRGLRVPEDLSVVGFDDIPLAAMSAVKLTTIKQPQTEMGKQAAKLVLDRLNGESKAPRLITYEPELILRDSTRRIG